MLAALVFAAGVEVSTRRHWSPAEGTPGFFLSDAARGQRLAHGYAGWFAGVPVKINSLGFRDDREYALAKGPRTFRVLVLGDSVTFGHGSVYEQTYPYLLEQRLRAWRPDVDWQVWNAAVPGYNTSQELAQLQLTAFDRLDDRQLQAAQCAGAGTLPADVVSSMRRERGWDDWTDAVRRLQQLRRDGVYRLMFFVNMAPLTCPSEDVFYDGGSARLNE